MNTSLRQRIPREEFDYQVLTSALKEYAFPRDHISVLIKNGDIVRVRKGLYVFGPTFRRREPSRLLLANLIYGPSYVSLEYALSHYGIIPERVLEVTSVTSRLKKEFDTPLGRFTYRPIPQRAYPAHISLVDLGDVGSCLMANPEKALADKLVAMKGGHFGSRAAVLTVLFDDLRCDEDKIREMKPSVFESMAPLYRSRRVAKLASALRNLRK
jgi:hypothetical protein